MTISKLIEELQNILNLSGNIDIVFSTPKEKLYSIDEVSLINEEILGNTCSLSGKFILQRYNDVQ